MKRFCAANLPIILMGSFIGAFPLSSQQLANNGSAMFYYRHKQEKKIFCFTVVLCSIQNLNSISCQL